MGALECAKQRAALLRTGRDDAQQQRLLTAEFAALIREGCGGAVSLPYAPFARLRFAVTQDGGRRLEHGWAWVRRLHRFPLERTALARARLQACRDAEGAVAQRCMGLLRELSSVPPGGEFSSSAAAVGSSSSREVEKQRYAAAHGIARWLEIRAAGEKAEEEVRAAEAAGCACRD